MADSPRIGKYFCRECKTTEVSQFALKSYSLCRACKRTIKGKKYFCTICFTDKVDNFTQGRYKVCKKCRYKPDLEAVKENMHKAVLEGKILIKDGQVHLVPSVIGVPESFFKSKKKKRGESDSDDSSESSSPGRDFNQVSLVDTEGVKPPNPREKMNMIMEAENVKQASLVGIFDTKQSMIASLEAKQSTITGIFGTEGSKGTKFPGETSFSKRFASVSNENKLVSPTSEAPVQVPTIADENRINNQIEKYLCFNENVFGVSFKSILENITQYNLQKDEYDIKRDEEIQFLREEIARLKYLLHES